LKKCSKTSYFPENRIRNRLAQNKKSLRFSTKINHKIKKA